MTEQNNFRPTEVEIDLDNLIYNFKSARAFIGDEIRYLGVVKANAYGHGAVRCARALVEAGVEWLGVAIPEEGFELREAGIETPILCLGGFWTGQEELLLKRKITPVIYRIEKAESLDRVAAALGLTADVHVKIDTGMGRIGVRHDQTAEFAESLKRFENLRVEGLMTHFAAADDLSQNEFTDRQIDRFERAVSLFRAQGFNPVLLDLANSPGAVAHPAGRGNMVRLGGILYGLSDDVLPRRAPKPALRPVLALRSRIAHLKTVPIGESLGYSRTFFTDRESLIATVPIGYADGLPRELSNQGKVLVNGRLAPIVGRISMDWTIIDVTDIPHVKLEDEVVIIGEQKGLRLTAEELALASGTISYEITCGISPRVHRKYVGSEEKPPV